MAKKLALSDFRAVRYKLEAHEFAISERQDIAPTDLIDEEVWHGITRLPDDVAIRTSDHQGSRLALLYILWRDWITAIGDVDKPDELFHCLAEAADAFQCVNFLFLHGFYRAAVSELRTALELVLIGSYGNLRPADKDYVQWKTSGSDIGLFARFRKRMHGMLTNEQCKWLLEDGEVIDKAFRQLCGFTHSHPDSNYAALWRSNGPVYVNDSIRLTFFTTTLVYAINYLLIGIARPDFSLPPDSKILFEVDWMPNQESLAKAFNQLYKQNS